MKYNLAGDFMKTKKLRVELISEVPTVLRIEAYEKVCRYLLQSYCEGCEKFECIGVFEGINGRTGRKGLFDTSPEN